MIRKSLHGQVSSLRVLGLCLAVLLLSGSVVVAGSPAAQANANAMTAARFLEQSSWGPTAATISQVQQGDLPTYLQQQFSAPISTYVTPGPTDDLSFVQKQFFVHALQGQDQLRQRVAFALSEIIVVSAVKDKDPTAMSLWMNMMQNDAFGNFYTLLYDVTLSPSMGYYLDMANNNGCTARCRPNENYGREILQLFSIGLQKLNIDGTPVLDQNNNPIPTYGQDENPRLWSSLHGLVVSRQARDYPSLLQWALFQRTHASLPEALQQELKGFVEWRVAPCRR
jgi:uncharacterized protein (DUF1800 family)